MVATYGSILFCRMSQFQRASLPLVCHLPPLGEVWPSAQARGPLDLTLDKPRQGQTALASHGAGVVSPDRIENTEEPAGDASIDEHELWHTGLYTES